MDPAVFERRLRPIYDHLDVGNNRKALQETEKLLKKHPGLLCGQALKGLALLRLGRVEESVNFLKAAADARPTDDPTLQVLSFCYKELEQLHKIVELYQYAVKENPGNEELTAHLFISHVRVEDFKAQQAVALQLYKAQPKNAYFFWAVMSVVLQGVRGPESLNPDKRKIFLALAQRMVDKHIAENKLASEQEVFLYLHILKLQNKFKEALEFLNGEVCEKLYPGAPVYMKIDLMKQLELWADISTLLKDLLKEDNDRWDYYKDYLSSCFELLETDAVASEKTDEDKDGKSLGVLGQCGDFLLGIIENAKKKVRGPYLARLELHKRMSAANLDADAFLGNLSNLVVEYFRLFGDKSCCTHDITLFLSSISMEARQNLATKLLLESGVSSSALPRDKEQMQMHICALQISRICGSHIDLKTEHLLAFYTALKLHYEHGRSTFGQNLLPTDMGPSDAYALLAANIMYDISIKEQKSDRLFEALCLLQYVLRNSTSNFHVKLLSLKIYHILGCMLGAQEMYEYLDIKQIQLDSMGYIHCNLLPLSGRSAMARGLMDSTLKFFTNSYKERLEYITLTYRYCTFSKLEEFMNFKDRLTNSIHYVAMTVEAQLSDLVTLYGNLHQNLEAYNAMSIDPATDRINWNNLTDNRDLSAIVRWDPVHLVDTEQERKDSFDQEMELLQIRSLELRLIAAMIDLFNPSAKQVSQRIAAATHAANNGQKPAKDTAVLDFILEAWNGLFLRVRQMSYQPLSQRFLVNLLPTRLHLMLDMPYEKFFTDLAKLVIDLYNGDNNLPLQCKVVSDNVTFLAELVATVIKESNASTEDGLWRRRQWQSKVASSLEMLSVYAFLLSVLNEKLQNLTSNKAKPKKKSTSIENELKLLVIHEKERVQLILELMRHLKLKFQNIDGSLRIWNLPALPQNIDNFMADMSLKPEVETTLIGDVASVFKEGHELMITELRNLIKDKIRMLNK